MTCPVRCSVSSGPWWAGTAVIFTVSPAGLATSVLRHGVRPTALPASLAALCSVV
nr:hypothetical protein [Mycobacterium sp.]